MLRTAEADVELRILRADRGAEQKEWANIVSRLPHDRQDVYFMPEYLFAYEAAGSGEACCAVLSRNDAILLYPFLKSAVAAVEDAPGSMQMHDLQSAYGYGGPVVNDAGENAEFLASAWKRFKEWCIGETIVSEFVRFHPLVENVRWAPPEMKVFEDRITIPVSLDRYTQELAESSYYRNHRQMLNKASRSGFTCRFSPAWRELDWFVPLYQQTQEDLDGSSETRFRMDYFSALSDGFGDLAWLAIVEQGSRVAAAVLVLEGPLYLHSHLMGYCRDIPTAGMTNLAYHQIALEGINRGKTIMHMGGGRTDGYDDPLFRFKRSLSPARSRFFLGTYCHNEAMYCRLAEFWERKNGPRPANYLQFYKLTGPIRIN